MNSKSLSPLLSLLFSTACTLEPHTDPALEKPLEPEPRTVNVRICDHVGCSVQAIHASKLSLYERVDAYCYIPREYLYSPWQSLSPKEICGGVTPDEQAA